MFIEFTRLNINQINFEDYMQMLAKPQTAAYATYQPSNNGMNSLYQQCSTVGCQDLLPRQFVDPGDERLLRPLDDTGIEAKLPDFESGVSTTTPDLTLVVVRPCFNQ